MTREEAWAAYEAAELAEREAFAAWKAAHTEAGRTFKVWQATAPELQPMNPGDEAAIHGADS